VVESLAAIKASAVYNDNQTIYAYQSSGQAILNRLTDADSWIHASEVIDVRLHGLAYTGSL